MGQFDRWAGKKIRAAKKKKAKETGKTPPPSSQPKPAGRSTPFLAGAGLPSPEVPNRGVKWQKPTSEQQDAQAGKKKPKKPPQQDSLF